MGLVRALLPQPPEPRHRLRWLGQARQGTFDSTPAIAPPLPYDDLLYLLLQSYGDETKNNLYC